MESVIEKECSALGGLFQSVIGDMKNSYPIWEDFISKAGKLQSQLRATVVAAAAFLDAFQKVADLATNTRGGTRDIGSALTRMCMRHRSIEAKLRDFSMAFMDCMINPLQDQIEEWKRGTNTLDKDHAKEYKKVRSEIKKKSLDTLKLQKKAKKADALGRGDVQPQLNSAMQDVSDKYLLLEETEKQAVRKALVEERSRLCTFVSMLRPVVDEEISMLGEVTHLQTISDDLKMLTMDPHKLPPASEQVILDLKGSDYNWSYQTPPSSPSTTRSRKSSMCSSLNSVNSSDSRSSGTSHSHSPSSSSCSSHYGYRSSTLPQQAAARLSSMSSHDSGFISQPDTYTSKSPSPMPQETLPQLSNGYDHYGDHHHSDSSYLMGGGSGLGGSYLMGGGSGLVGSYPLFPPSSHSTSITSSSSSCPSQSWSRPGSALLPDYPHYCTLGPNMVPTSKVPSWKDWAKPGPYDQPMVNTLRRRKDKDPVPADTSYAPLPLPAGVIPAPGGRSLPLPAGVIPAPGGRSLPLPAGVIPAPGSRSQALPPPPKVCEMEAHEELALALSRGLQLDSHTQRSSRDSLHCSSGYSTQSTTPCCSEDTIPSQGCRRLHFPFVSTMLPSLQRVLRPALILRSGNMLGRVRGSNLAPLRQPVPMLPSQQSCDLGTHPHKDPMEPLNSPQGAKDFIYSLHPTERTTLLRELHRFESIAIAQGEMVIAPPTSAQLRYVLLHNAIPFVGFGFLDNAIMIVAGTQIELSIGVILGISTMAAAALGNLVSDLAGLGLAGYVEALACRCGLVGPDLNPKQADMWQTRVSTHSGKAIGVAIGCILGMFPLLFFKDETKKKAAEREGKDGSLTSISTGSSSS